MVQVVGYTIPAPSAGINLVDPIDQMDPIYALNLINIVAAGSTSFLRNGYEEHTRIGSTNTTPVICLQGINHADGQSTVLAQTNNKLYRTSTGGSSGTAASFSGSPFNSDTFGYRAYFANGVDDVQVYSGGTAGTFASSTFTGATLANLINVSSYKERLYFVEKETLKVWYGNTQALGSSALSSFDFQFAMKDGGFLVQAGSYSNNYADSTQDLFYALSSQGELVFYNGSSPADVTTPWGIVKRAKIGRPLGYRSFIRVGADTWIITDQGIVSIASLFSTTPEQALRGVGDKINSLIAQQAKTIPFSHLWSGVFWSSGRRIYLTMPLSTANTMVLVYHIDGGWSKYLLGDGGDALTLTTAAKNIYYGGTNGYVYLGETGYRDKVTAISFSGLLAFNFFGSRGQFKAFKDCRPLMRTARNINLALGLNVDFRQDALLSNIAVSSGTFTPWGSPWGSAWSTGIEYMYDRGSISGQGHSAALTFSGSLIDAPLEFYGFEIGFEPGSRV